MCFALGAGAVRRVRPFVDGLELGDRGPGVELSGGEPRVAEQRLEVEDLSAVLEHQDRHDNAEPKFLSNSTDEVRYETKALICGR